MYPQWWLASKYRLKILAFNCLRKLPKDDQFPIPSKIYCLLLSETLLSDEEDFQLLYFDCKMKLQRKNVGATLVSIYHSKNVPDITTLNLDLTVQNACDINVSQADVGNLCASQILMDVGTEILFVLYFLLNKIIKDAI